MYSYGDPKHFHSDGTILVSLQTYPEKFMEIHSGVFRNVAYKHESPPTTNHPPQPTPPPTPTPEIKENICAQMVTFH